MGRNCAPDWLIGVGNVAAMDLQGLVTDLVILMRRQDKNRPGREGLVQKISSEAMHKVSGLREATHEGRKCVPSN